MEQAIQTLPGSPRRDWLHHPNPEVREMADQMVGTLRAIRQSQDSVAVVRAIAAIITPMVLDYLTIDDIWAQIFDYYDWTDTRTVDHRFRLPPEVQGYKEVISYTNGTTLPVFTVAQKFVGVLPEEIATPEFSYDTGELDRPDAIVSLQDVEELTGRMIEIYKSKTGYLLLGDGFTNPATNLDVVVDDGSLTPNGMTRTYLVSLRDRIESHTYEMQDKLGGHPQLTMLARQITYDQLQRVGIFGSAGTTDPWMDRVRIAPTLKAVVMPAGTDNLDQWAVKANNSRPIFTEGDMFILGPRIGAYALTRALDPSTIMRDHWMAAVAWRLAYAWVRWVDIGDLSRIRRMLVIKKLAAGGIQGTLSFDGLFSQRAFFYSSRPVDPATITNANIIIASSAGGGTATGTLTPLVKGDLRHFVVTFATPLTSGAQYFVRSTTGLHDLATEQILAMPEVTTTCQ